MSLQIGDSVIVNDGVKESDKSDVDISRWHGRVVKILDEVDDDEIPMVQVEWDSFTLKQMPKDYIAESEEEGIDWKSMELPQSNVKKTQPRDTIGVVRVVQDKIYDMYVLGDAAERVASIVDDDSLGVTIDALERWLEQCLCIITVPQTVIIEDNDGDQRLPIGAMANIIAFAMADDLYGIIATIVYKTKKFEIPLYNLKSLFTDTPSAQLIEDYKVWFVNS